MDETYEERRSRKLREEVIFAAELYADFMKDVRGKDLRDLAPIQLRLLRAVEANRLNR